MRFEIHLVFDTSVLVRWVKKRWIKLFGVPVVYDDEIIAYTWRDTTYYWL